MAADYINPLEKMMEFGQKYYPEEFNIVTLQMMDKLARAEANLNFNSFQEIFGESIGQHLWKRFADNFHSLLALWREMDHGNRQCFIEYLKKI